MFRRKDNPEMNKLVKTVQDLENSKNGLQDKIVDLKVQARELKLTRDIEIRDIKHLVKLKEEKLDIVADKKELERERASDAKIRELSNEYRNKTEAFLEKSRTEMREMYKEVLDRLPNIEVGLRGKV